MGSIGCILLDIGKVLIDFDFRNFAARMHDLTGLGVEPLRAAITGEGLIHRYEFGQLSDPEFHEEICRRLGKDIPLEDFAAAWNSIFPPTSIIPDDLLSTLTGKAALWLLSNTNHLHMEFIAQRYDFMRHFRGSVLSYEIGLAKPDPQIFRHALNKAGVQAADTLFVDDGLENVEAARGLGIDALQFQGVHHLRRELESRDLLPK